MTMRCIAQLNSELKRLPTVIEVGCADGQGTMRYAGFCNRVVAIDAMMTGRPDIVRNEDGTLDVQGVGVIGESEYITDSVKWSAFVDRTKDLPVDLVVGLSTDPETIEKTRDALSWYTKDGLADIIVIDGCHHPFEAVWADIEAYLPFLRVGGFMIIDDLYEDCILQCWDKAKADLGMEELDRWRVDIPGTILQECGALRRVR